MKKNHPQNIFAYISLLLVATITFSALVACSEPEKKETETSVTTAPVATEEVDETTEQRILPNLPENDFDGYEFNVLHWYVPGWESRMSKDIEANEQNGDPINDAVYTRNFNIKEKYNVTFKLQNEKEGDIPNIVRRNVQSNDDIYDAVFARVPEAGSLIESGMFLDINQLEYIDLSQPWWDANSVESLSVYGKLFMVASDISIVDKDGTAAIAFGKQDAVDNNMPDLYQLVRDGKWTIGTMTDLYKDVARDLDGNQIMDENDFYGFLGGHDVSATFFQGSGARIMEKNEDDVPYISFESDRNYQIAETLYNLVTDTAVFYHHHIMDTDDSEYEDLFANRHGLFFWMRLDNVTSLRSSDNDFGILPIPKYDEAQENYNCTVSIHTSGLLSVPVSASQPDRTGFILEALAAESKYTLIPAYYEKALKGKSLRDNESEEMLDIIINNRVFDIAEMYGIGGGLNSIMLYLANNKTFNVASQYAKSEKATQRALDKFLEKIEKL